MDVPKVVFVLFFDCGSISAQLAVSHMAVIQDLSEKCPTQNSRQPPARFLPLTLVTEQTVFEAFADQF